MGNVFKELAMKVSKEVSLLENSYGRCSAVPDAGLLWQQEEKILDTGQHCGVDSSPACPSACEEARCAYEREGVVYNQKKCGLLVASLSTVAASSDPS